MVGTALPALADEAAVLARWQMLRAVKVEAQKVLEELRVAGKIGSSLAAEVEVRASGQRHDCWQPWETTCALCSLPRK